MFTGIVEETGQVLAFTARDQAWRLVLSAQTALQGVALGDSIAVNGCCLTVVGIGENRLEFDLLEETRRVTSIGQVPVGGSVNLERSLRFDGKVGGHFVTGHVDGLGEVTVLEERGRDLYLKVRGVPTFGRYLIPKGSIAVDGISLTVAEVDGDSFAVWLIPHTRQVTNLREKRVGDPVNLEYDLLGKYVEKLGLASFAQPSR
ncbi:MAG: riboflavin synthase [Opitutaceae bacterium]|nr:riboflavin synthase [Opitutaceae bacterium]